MPELDCDLIIVGGGVAGLTSGLYSCRAGLKTILLERLGPGGQTIKAERIENFPGFPEGISGVELGLLVQDQAMRYGLEVRLAEVNRFRREGLSWIVETHDYELRADAVIMAGGSALRKLGVSGEERLHGAGVSYCATCDGAFFRDQVVGVVGGGDSALDEAIVLTKFASQVIVFHRGDHLDAQRILQDRAFSSPKVVVRWNTVVNRILGEGQVEAVSTLDSASGQASRIELSGVFIYVGLDPNTQCLRDFLPMDNAGHIPTDIRMRTAIPGLLAAGDVRQASASQFISAAGDGATAAIEAQRYLESREWPT